MQETVFLTDDHSCRKPRLTLQVLGLEQHTIAHNKGSSHGESRIIRIAYHEHPDYVPLLQRAWALWLELQQKSGKVDRLTILCTDGNSASGS